MLPTLIESNTLFLHADTRNIPKGAKDAALIFAGYHLSPTTGAVVANLSQSGWNVPLFRATAIGIGTRQF